jgi:hypothetical protein
MHRRKPGVGGVCLLPGLHTFRTFTAVLSRIAVCSFRRESGTCMPPFFRTSAGHRVEGRNPWHLHYSRNQLHAGTHCRRLVRSLSLRPSWLLASWADQTELGLSLPKASTSGLPAPKSPCGLPDITTAPNGELRRQDFHLQVQQLSRTLKVRGGIISQANRYLGGFCSSQGIFPPQIIQVLLLLLWAAD